MRGRVGSVLVFRGVPRQHGAIKRTVKGTAEENSERKRGEALKKLLRVDKRTG